MEVLNSAHHIALLPPFYCQGYTDSNPQKEGRTGAFVKQSTTKERINYKVNCCYTFCELQQPNAVNKNKIPSYPHSPLTSIVTFHESMHQGWMQTACKNSSLHRQLGASGNIQKPQNSTWT